MPIADVGPVAETINPILISATAFGTASIRASATAAMRLMLEHLGSCGKPSVVGEERIVAGTCPRPMGEKECGVRSLVPTSIDLTEAFDHASTTLLPDARSPEHAPDDGRPF